MKLRYIGPATRVFVPAIPGDAALVEAGAVVDVEDVDVAAGLLAQEGVWVAAESKRKSSPPTDTPDEVTE